MSSSKKRKSKYWAYSFPVASIFLGLFVGIFMFLQSSPDKEESLNKRIFKPVTTGLTITYLMLTLGINLRLGSDKPEKQEK